MEGLIFGLLSAAILAVCGAMYRMIRKLYGEFSGLKDSQRNQIKMQIVSIYESSCTRGYVTHMELETCNRLHDSYLTLGGNTYVSALINHMNNDLQVKGQEIPTH